MTRIVKQYGTTENDDGEPIPPAPGGTMGGMVVVTVCRRCDDDGNYGVDGTEGFAGWYRMPVEVKDDQCSICGRGEPA